MSFWTGLTGLKLQSISQSQNGKRNEKLLLIMALLCIACCTLKAAEVPLAWDQSPSPSVTNNRVYYGAASRIYNSTITIAKDTAYTVKNLALGTYCFAVTAIDGDGNESDFSNEVCKTLGGAPAAPSNFQLSKVSITNTYPPPKVAGSD